IKIRLEIAGDLKMLAVKAGHLYTRSLWDRKASYAVYTPCLKPKSRRKCRAGQAYKLGKKDLPERMVELHTITA
ncbi:MAG: hypothetical protein ACPG80_06255, partial [Rickettsiales bacterium]